MAKPSDGGEGLTRDAPVTPESRIDAGEEHLNRDNGPYLGPLSREHGISRGLTYRIDSIWDRYVDPVGRKIYIGPHEADGEGEENGIDGRNFLYVAQGLDLLESLRTGDLEKDRITFVLNFEGGGWYDALAIYDRIRNCPCKTVMHSYGAIMSAAPTILQAADIRLISSKATMMFHDGTVPSEAEDARTTESLGKFSSKIDRPRMYAILAQRSALTAKQIADLCKGGDWYLTPPRAVEHGFVDKVMRPRDFGVDVDFARFKKIVEKKNTLNKDEKEKIDEPISDDPDLEEAADS